MLYYDLKFVSTLVTFSTIALIEYEAEVAEERLREEREARERQDVMTLGLYWVLITIFIY